MPIANILILGGGIAGISSALALSKMLSPIVPGLRIRVFELQEVPSTSGGAINLTPVAQRHLDYLGVLEELNKMGPGAGADVDAIQIFSMHSGQKIGAVDFAGKDRCGYGGYKGRRVMRICLLLAMLTTAEKAHNIEVVFGKKAVGGEESHRGVTVSFADGSMAAGDLALGCDGVHSNTRTKIVDPDRASEYTGISIVQTTVRTEEIKSRIHFKDTALNWSRHGSIITSFFDRDHEEIFVGALAEMDEHKPSSPRPKGIRPERWKQHQVDPAALRLILHERLGRSGTLPCIREILNKSPFWLQYPVYQLSPGGKWFTERVLLLGDAAHAMPPRDESAAYALDDSILFARVLAQYASQPPATAFKVYDRLRRDTVNHAYKMASDNWECHRETGLLASKVREWSMPWYLRRTNKVRKAAWLFDASKVDLNIPDHIIIEDRSRSL